MAVNNNQTIWDWLYTFGQVQSAVNKHIYTVASIFQAIGQ
jgi:hypothetical protein